MSLLFFARGLIEGSIWPLMLVWTAEVVACTLIASRVASARIHMKPISLGLSVFDDRRTLRPLLDGLLFTRGQELELLHRALVRLLPRVDAEDVRDLSDRHWYFLNQLLQLRPDTELKAELLMGTIELSARAGDRRLGGSLKKLAAGRHAASTHPELRAAAAAALLQIPAASGKKKALPPVIE
jgi:hypothetical protein